MEYDQGKGQEIGFSCEILMGFVRIKYEDEEGRKFLVELPEECQDMPENGIRIGPPELDELGWPIELEVKMNNQLFDRKLFTEADVRRRPKDIVAAYWAVLRTDVLKIRSLYKEVKR